MLSFRFHLLPPFFALGEGTFVVAKKGELEWERLSGGKSTKLMVIADAVGLPLAVHAMSASPHV
jgi:hypothetical protein